MKKDKTSKAVIALVSCLIVALAYEVFKLITTKTLSSQAESMGMQLDYHTMLFIHFVVIFPLCISTLGLAIYLLLNRQKIGLSIISIMLAVFFAFPKSFSIGTKSTDIYSINVGNNLPPLKTTKLTGRKGKHYNILSKEFRQTQEIVEVNGFVAVLKNNLRIKPYNVDETSENRNTFEETVSDELLYEPIFLRLPEFEDFRKNYFIAGASSISREKALYRKKGEKFTVPVPVLIYTMDDEELINERF